MMRVNVHHFAHRKHHFTLTQVAGTKLSRLDVKPLQGQNLLQSACRCIAIELIPFVIGGIFPNVVAILNVLFVVLYAKAKKEINVM